MIKYSKLNNKIYILKIPKYLNQLIINKFLFKNNLIIIKLSMNS